MKNVFKLIKKEFFRIILAIALVFAISAVGCDNGSTDEKDPGDGEKPAPTLVGITAVYTGTATIYPTTPLDNLKTGLTVRANYSDNTSKTLNPADYTLIGTLTVGTRSITVTYEGKTTTFNVTVANPALTNLPGDITISPNTNVYINTELTATYNGSESVSYLWYKDGLPLNNARSDKYTPTVAGSYHVNVGTAGSNAKSSAPVVVSNPFLTGISL